MNQVLTMRIHRRIAEQQLWATSLDTLTPIPITLQDSSFASFWILSILLGRCVWSLKFVLINIRLYMEVVFWNLSFLSSLRNNNNVTILFQVYFLDRFFGYQFSTYGTDVLRISELPIEERVDPMSKVFPKVKVILNTWDLEK